MLPLVCVQTELETWKLLWKEIMYKAVYSIDSSSLFLFLSVQSLPGVHIEGDQPLSEPPSQVRSLIGGGLLLP